MPGLLYLKPLYHDGVSANCIDSPTATGPSGRCSPPSPRGTISSTGCCRWGWIVGWRRLAVAETVPSTGGRFLDVATRNGRHGVGDRAPERRGCVRRRRRPLRGDDAGGAREVRTGGAIRSVAFFRAPGECLPFRDASFDSACIAFGIRNVADRERGLRRCAAPSGPGARGSSRILLAVGDGLRRPVPVLLQERPAADRGIFSRGPPTRTFPSRCSRSPILRLRRDDAGGGLRFRYPPPLTFGIVTLYVGVR